MASKSAMGFPRSNGLERYKMSSSPAGPAVAGCRDLRPMRGRWRLPVFAIPWVLPPAGAMEAATPTFVATSRDLVGRDRSCREHLALVGLDQLHIEAQRLQF